MTIPYRERGYSVELAILMVHERYQDHAPTAVRTTALGVDNIRRLHGEVTPCEECFPPLPEPKRTPRRAAAFYRPIVSEPPAGPYWQTTTGEPVIVEDAPSPDEGTSE